MRTRGRQTSFSLGKLIELIKQNGLGFPICLLLNEIGEICYKEIDRTGEAFLTGFLTNPDHEYRAVAFSWLTAIEERDKTHSQSLVDFRNNPANQGIVQIVQMVNRKLAQMRAA